MEYKELMQRYWQAETTPAEEKWLREQLLNIENPSPEERALKAMMLHPKQSCAEARVHLRQPKHRGWQYAIGTAVCSLALVGIVTITKSKPTIYGYYNGEPITSFSEAQYRAECMFANLSPAEAPSEEEIMNKLFSLD